MKGGGPSNKVLVNKENDIVAVRTKQLDQLGEQVMRRLEYFDSIPSPSRSVNRTQNFIDGLFIDRGKRLEQLTIPSPSRKADQLASPTRLSPIGASFGGSSRSSCAASPTAQLIGPGGQLDDDTSLKALRTIADVGSRQTLKNLGGSSKLIYRGGYDEQKHRVRAVFPNYKVDLNKKRVTSELFEVMPLEDAIKDRQNFRVGAKQMNQAISEAGNVANDRLNIALIESTSSYSQDTVGAHVNMFGGDPAELVKSRTKGKGRHRQARAHNTNGASERRQSVSFLLYQMLDKTIKPTCSIANMSAHPSTLNTVAVGEHEHKHALAPLTGSNYSMTETGGEQLTLVEGGPRGSRDTSRAASPAAVGLDLQTSLGGADEYLDVSALVEEDDEDDEEKVLSPDELPDDQVDELTRIQRFVSRCKQV